MRLFIFPADAAPKNPVVFIVPAVLAALLVVTFVLVLVYKSKCCDVQGMFYTEHVPKYTYNTLYVHIHTLTNYDSNLHRCRSWSQHEQ